MNPRELLRLATVLAHETGGSPRWVARNRAVSTAYYALFHALAELCGRELVGARRPWPAFRHVYRSLDHGAARRMLDSVRRDVRASEASQRLGALFGDLQDQRHAADYDPGYRIARRDLAALVASTSQVIAALDDLPRSERKLLAARLIGRTRG